MKDIPFCLILTLILLALSHFPQATSASLDTTCTFHDGSKVFSLIYLETKEPYEEEIDNPSDNTESTQTVQFNFCKAFIPSVCPKDTKSSYSFLITEQINDTLNENNQSTKTYTCTRYSSNLITSLFTSEYSQTNNGNILKFSQQTENFETIDGKKVKKSTVYEIKCGEAKELEIESVIANATMIYIKGESNYACPVFEVSKIWSIFEDNWILIGIVLAAMGIHLLFFGRVAIETTIFIAAFLICFAVVGAIFTVFVSPHSSTFVIYLSFLFLLFISTMLAYGVTKLVGVSIFFVGAILGFIIGILVNSIFASIFNIYSVWSLVIFIVLFAIPLGLLSFKFRDHIIIASSSLTGSYFIVRPISWIFGGFPNEFLLYEKVQTGQLTNLPWTFYLYLILIIALAIVGAMYQLLKLYRENPEEQHEINFIQLSIEEPIDSIKTKVDKLINRFKSDSEAEDYKKVNELQDTIPNITRKSEETPHKADYF